MTVTAEFMVEVSRLLRALAGPECSCRVCLDARIAAEQIDRQLAQEGADRG